MEREEGIPTWLVPELRHEFPMELLDAAHPFCARREKSCTKMQSPFFLAKAGTRHDAHAGGIEES